jgi:very-short-patch-repair endonuclease
MPRTSGHTTQPIDLTRLFGGRLTIDEALKQLRLRLLDLTARNRLLNFRHSATKTIQVVDAVPTAVYDRLVESKTLRFVPVPDPKLTEYVEEPRRHKPDVRDYARKLGISTSFDLRRAPASPPATGSEGAALRVLAYPEDLERQCRRIAKEARSAIEETGTNMLYLVFGFLEWYESDASDKGLLAPLIAVPVALKKGTVDPETRLAVYDLNYTGDEISDNLSLREKLKVDFGVNLPEFNEDAGPEEYFDRIENAVKKRDRWKVRRQLTLTLLSFAKLLIVRDLDPKNWPKGLRQSELIEHELVRTVFGDLSTGEGGGLAREDYDIDNHPENNLALIYDADTSQHSALIDALEGKNLVVDGPPGTGKSQTITNLIAESLVRGKRVLFVSEKLAALEVVRNRLELAGLDDFCLELHSHKTNKKRVVDALAARLGRSYPAPAGFGGQLESLERKKKDLQQYANLMNAVIGNALELSVFQVMWRSERYRQASGDYVEAVKDISVANAIECNLAGLGEREAVVDALARLYASTGGYSEKHPWYGFFPSEFSPGDDLRVQASIEELISCTRSIEGDAARLRASSGDQALDTSESAARELSRALSELPEPGDKMRADLLERFFGPDDPSGTQATSILEALRERIARAQELIVRTRGQLLPGVVPSEELLERAHALLRSLRQHGLHALALAELAERVETLHKIASGCERSLGALAQLEEVLGGQLARTDIGLKRALAILTVCHEAPQQLLEYRQEGFANASAKELLAHAQRELIHLRGQEKALSALFYFDTPVEATALQEALATFREGSAWYRFLQRRWRRARKFYRALSRDKVKREASECAENLATLAAFMRARERFNANQDYKGALGRLFRGEESDFGKLGALASWYERAHAHLVAAGLSFAHFNITTVDAFRIAEIAGRYGACKAHITALHEATAQLNSLIAASQHRAEITNETLEWQRRLEILNTLIAEAQEATEFFELLGSRSASAEELEHALRGVQAAANLCAAVENDERAQTLLGVHFAGLETDLAVALETLHWGRAVAQARLPNAVSRRLLTAEAKALLPRLRQDLEVLCEHWRAIGTFEEAMRRLGDFEWDKWMAAAGTAADKGSASPAAIRERAQHALGSLNGLLSWAQYVHARKRLRKLGLLVFAERLENGRVSAEALVDAFVYRFHATIAESIFRSNTVLARFSGTTHAQLREQFAQLDRKIIAMRGKECAARVSKEKKPPAGSSGIRVEDKTEMELIKHLMGLQRPRTPIRQMMKRAGAAVQTLKPCFMMGPLAVAQYLEPGAVEFDLVIMDEASQLRPEDAIGSVARGKQLVVVGDPKQLPPTSFFDRMMSVDDDGEESAKAAAVDSESILDICLSLFPKRTLKWHYRSQHESLIAFSNTNFYDNRLIVFPTPYPRTRHLGLQYFHVSNGQYQNRQNIPEATRIVDAVIEHMAHRPEDSLGVVTLNITQRDLVEELLEKRLRSFSAGEEFQAQWESKGWPFFVKNLENVQGDERDVIFISTTFGKVPGTDVVRQNFGPVSRDLGWRRLNVLFTRARKSVHVFSSMRPEDIVVDGNTRRGTQALRGYLEYAANGNLISPTFVPREPDSDFEVAVAEVLASRGFEVVPQLGVAGFFIDMAVRNPERPGEYLAAIECDGATYHSGVSVRDRDRIRQQILESLGWKGKIWRIWSTDWFRDPRREIERLMAFLEARRVQAEREPRPVELEETEEARESAFDAVLAPALGALGASDLAEPDVTLAAESAVSEDEELYVEVGDSVTYVDLAKPEARIMVQIVDRPTDPNAGLVNEGAPLAKVLLGAAEGDEVELSVPARPTQVLKIFKIQRARAETAA